MNDRPALRRYLLEQQNQKATKFAQVFKESMQASEMLAYPVAGGVLGSIVAPEGRKTRGALYGAGIGGGAALGSAFSHSIANGNSPLDLTAKALGTAGGGALGYKVIDNLLSQLDATNKPKKKLTPHPSTLTTELEDTAEWSRDRVLNLLDRLPPGSSSYILATINNLKNQ